jgi:hypothetical protein
MRSPARTLARPSAWVTLATLIACSGSSGVLSPPPDGDNGTSADGSFPLDSSPIAAETGSDSGTSTVDARAGDAHVPDAHLHEAGGFDASTTDGAGLEGSTVDGPGLIDGAPDASQPLTLPTCLGTSAPTMLSGTWAYTAVEIGTDFGADAGLTPPAWFLVDFGSTESDVDLSAFSPAPATMSCTPSQLGQFCTFSELDFFGLWSSPILITSDFSAIKGTVRQAGILATDFLSLYPFTIDYQGQRILEGQNPGFCADADLKAAGFAPMTTHGFYSSDLGTLNLLSTVDSAVTSTTETVPNVPTVKLRIGGVDAVAQLDTGFQDSVVHHSVNINQAFFSAIVAKTPGALQRDSSLDVTLTTCVAGTSESVKAYHLVAGNSMDFVSDSGSPARSVSDAVVFVKNTPAAAQVCGGIGTWTVPAAQVATSFYFDAGAIVFDPLSERVWIPQ